LLTKSANGYSLLKLLSFGATNEMYGFSVCNVILFKIKFSIFVTFVCCLRICSCMFFRCAHKTQTKDLVENPGEGGPSNICQTHWGSMLFKQKVNVAYTILCFIAFLLVSPMLNGAYYPPPSGPPLYVHL
jgi:hypothetical protein